MKTVLKDSLRANSLGSGPGGNRKTLAKALSSHREGRTLGVSETSALRKQPRYILSTSMDFVVMLGS